MGSELIGDVFTFREEEISLVEANGRLVSSTEAWRSSRAPAISHWSWPEIVKSQPDAFAAVAGGALVGLWSGRSSKPKTLDGQPMYVVDYMEVAPERRGGPWGIALLSLCCLRAEEVGAKGLAIPAIPELKTWYGAIGFEVANKYAWKVEFPLIAMLLRNDNFGTLLGLAHASRKEER